MKQYYVMLIRKQNYSWLSLQGRGTFPYEVSILEIQTELDWNPTVVSLGTWPLYICDDGCLVYYRDSKEKLAELTEEQRKEIEVKENSR